MSRVLSNLASLWFLWFFLLLGTLTLIVVYRELPTGALQLDGDLHLRLIDLIVLAERLETAGQDLNTQSSVGNALVCGAPVRIGFKLEATLVLLPSVTGCRMTLAL